MNFKKYYEKILASKSKYIIVIGFIGIFLITISAFSTKKTKPEPKEVSSTSFTTTNSEEYVNKLENKINSIISQIQGVGNSKVIITLEKGVENIYANSEKKATNLNENLSGKMSKRDDIQKDVVIIDGTQGKQALIVTQKEPTIRGVIIICEGADNPKTVADVVNSVSKCLNIGTNRLSVVKGAISNK